jgi:3-oxoacyl-[acyl-carrier-protein] synthase II
VVRKCPLPLNPGTPRAFDAVCLDARPRRYTQLGVAASKLAMEDAGLDASGLRPERFGVIMGTAFGGLGTLETQIREMDKGGPAKVSPFAVPMLLGNTISGIIAIELGALGPNYGAYVCLGG